jgi:predicted NUDIX family NTP pyrophosphohydrolase
LLSDGSAVPETSAGILLFRRRAGSVELLLVHPGGPFWANKDDGAWSIPKGLYEADEDALVAAQREFEEETGARIEGDFLGLGEFRLPNGKRLLVWAIEGGFDPDKLTSNEFEMEWPPRSGKRARFPEVDRAGWFPPESAKTKITRGQVQVVEALLNRVAT